MRKLLLWFSFLIFLGHTLTFQTASSHSNQPDTGSVKDPVNNNTCAKAGCHSTYSSFNASRANVTIGTTSGNQVPLNGFQYTPGTQYIMNFTVLGNSARPGFSMSALTSANANAGTFAVINATNTSLQTLGAIKYIGHKSASSNSTWSFNWTAPATNVGNVTFYSAVNKSNNNNSDSGDSIFHQQYVITAAQVSLTVSAGNDVSFCPGGSAPLQATASTTSGTTYAWSPASGLSCTNCANPTASPGSTTTYTVTVTNGAQTASDAVVVNVYTTNAPTINTTAHVVCPGNTVTLSSAGFSSYVWSTGSNAAIASVTSGGTYSLTVTDANGCSTTASKAITQGQTATTTISSTQPYLCSNSTTLSAGSFTGYQWSNSSTNATISVSQAGSYAVTVTNATGCTGTASFNLQAYAPSTANVTASGPLSFCIGGNVTLTANPGTSYTYKWSTGATTQNITVVQSGNYRVTVYNPCDSAVSGFQNVVANAIPAAQLSPDGPVLLCNGVSQTLFATPTGGGYVWLKDGTIINGQSADTFSVNTSGSYSVVVTQGICSDTSQTVSVSTAGSGNSAVDIVATQSSICPGETVSLDAGTGFTTYSWLPGNVASQTLQVTTAGTYIVNITNNNGQCTSTGADTITIDAGVAVQVPVLTYDSATCAGDTISIAVTPNTYSSYVWSNGSALSSLTDVTGSYTVTVSQAGFCGTASAAINAPGTPLPDASFTANNAVLSAATSGGQYQWYLEGAEINGAVSNSYTATQTGNYSLQVTVGGCSNTSAEQMVIVNGLADVAGDVSYSVFPNPVMDVLSIATSADRETELQLSISNLDGRVVKQVSHVVMPVGKLVLRQDISALPQGVYILQLQTVQSSTTFRLIKGL